jgi:predicted metalloendopeptidase
MQRVLARKDFQTLREVVDHRAWGDLPPTIVNAFYEPSTNAICIIYQFLLKNFINNFCFVLAFPAGILQMPYFNKDAPK